MSSSKLVYEGSEVSTSEFMPSKGFWRNRRIFTMPGDGRSFEWKLGLYHSTLFSNDGLQTPVAHSHRSNSGAIGQARQARLEIYPGFEHLVDTFVVTYVYAEKLRRDREKRRRLNS